MADDLIEPHEATGDLELVAVRYAPGRNDSEGIVSLRWRDAGSGRLGQSSRGRLALMLERDAGNIFVHQDDAKVPVEVAPADDGRGAILRAMAGDADLILALPTY
jgi:hypothetical protein